MTNESASDDATLYEIAAEDRSAVSRRFDDFRIALEALCIEHGVRITGSRDYDDYSNYLELATEEDPAGFDFDLVDCIPPTPEEQAELDRRAEVEAARRKAEEAQYQDDLKKYAERIASPEYLAMRAEEQRLANRPRSDYMRISTDPTDPAYIDARPRRVWLNNVEIKNWIVADEFRRCVIAPGKHEGDTVVMHGAVLIERLPAVRFTRLPEHDNDEPGFDGWHDHVTDSLWLVPQGEDPNITHATPPGDTHPEASTSLSGMLVKVEEATPEAPAATFAVPTVPVKAAAMSAKPAKKSKKAR